MRWRVGTRRCRATGAFNGIRIITSFVNLIPHKSLPAIENVYHVGVRSPAHASIKLVAIVGMSEETFTRARGLILLLLTATVWVSVLVGTPWRVMI